MRFLISIIVCAVLAFVLELFFPWWSVAIAAFVVAFVFQLTNGKAFMVGFLGVFLLWLIVALVASHANENILANRMAQLFHLPNAIIFILVAAIIGGVLGGMAAWSGAVIRRLIAEKR